MRETLEALLSLLSEAPAHFRDDPRLIPFKQNDVLEEALHAGLVRMNGEWVEPAAQSQARGSSQ
jgi:hypothetical protein